MCRAYLRNAGANASDLLAAGVSISELLDAGYGANDLLAAGVTEGALIRAGVDASDLYGGDSGIGLKNNQYDFFFL
mgnify:CR=1 FL=1